MGMVSVGGRDAPFQFAASMRPTTKSEMGKIAGFLDGLDALQPQVFQLL